ncbi:uncharacterized protein TRIADDRAFT_55346 [Trichoplax adhaerens]|uniref:Mediator of RNA polymerase II transcription subunit 20 n=1 Tax=Trichoplax adhaerens TaxID=10228 RepID=B3RUM6_TRIAD|nr:hypothetical protein TRIADDRAFT_55346 [Trichoplax adhaerens]EDV25846.1 hypothetical protein TRIADDRAFT_55346 [Trichoplax adhaerens]|eukprot:XP_002111879.1 hypothetical protein TRIADDRAFT_55346 [Trichoplax adhaerens]
MGVTIVGLCAIPPEKTSQQVIDVLVKRLTNLFADVVGVWSLDFEHYQANTDSLSSKNVVYSLAWSDNNTKYIMHNNDDGQIVPMESADEFTDNIKNYTLRKSLKAHGQTLLLGDFIVKLSSIVGGHTSLTDIVIEANYKPCSHVGVCWNLLHEFCKILTESYELSLPETPPLNILGDGTFDKSQTATQYADIFINHKKAVTKSL